MSGVVFKPLRQIADSRGKIMHMMRADDDHFSSFGEVYFSWINPGIIKGWTQHKIMTVNLAVPVGRVRIVVRNLAGDVQEYISGEDEYGLLSIPPGHWYGFQCLGDVPAMIANCASHPHMADEMMKADLDDPSFSYKWPAV